MSKPFFDESIYTEKDRDEEGWPRITPPMSTTVPVFISHTSLDIPSCEKWILPAIKRAIRSPLFLDYYSFANPVYREAYARQIIVYLRCSEHLVIVLSERTLQFHWVKEEVSWWLKRRGPNDITVASLDDTKRNSFVSGLSNIKNIDFSNNVWQASRILTTWLRKKLASSVWLV